MDKRYSIEEVQDMLDYTDPAQLSYEEWMQIGMGLKSMGASVQMWEDWSAKDTRRFHQGECEKKWNSFQSSGITVGTIVTIARSCGWLPPYVRDGEGRELGLG